MSRFLLAIATIIISYTTVSGQAPTWVAGTPAIAGTGPLSITCSYGINMTGRVYIAVLGNVSTTDFVGSTIRSVVLGGVTASWVAVANLPVNAGDENKVFQVILDVPQASKTYTVYFAAENSSGVIQALSTRIYATTKPCPSITFLNQLLQPEKCVNYGAEATYEIVPNANPLISGILKGTDWIIDWGDGTVVTYKSTADNDIPPLAMLTHSYSNITNCNYIFSCGVKNPCGMTYSPQYVAVVHGRDQQSDGDGRLRIVNNDGGSSLIQVCAGTETTITVRDNSIWNCQNPVVPTGFTAQPNLEPREIEWLYGRDPGGALTNTITGAVAVATMGNAPRVSGRFSPLPYGPASLAKAVTIPSTCKAGEYFRIYLKNWNKCNWTDPEYIYTYVDILVIAAPPAPTVPGRTICFGDATTLTVTSSAVGTLTWYSDAGLTNVLGTGSTYTPTILIPGTYHYWVTDQSLSGLMCRSQATEVILKVIQTITNNSISIAQNICYNTTPAPLTGTPPGGGDGTYSYQWQISSDNSNWNDIGGANGINFSPGQMTATRWFRRIVTSGPCSLTSNSIRIFVYGTLNGGQIRINQSICYNTDPALFTNFSSPSGGTSLTYGWEWSPAGTGSWSTISGETGLTFNESTNLTANRDYRRVTTSGAGCGTAYSNILTVTVYADLNPGTIGANQTICEGDNPVLLTQTAIPSGGIGTYTYQWQSSPDDVTFSDISGANSSTYDPPVLAATTYYRRAVTSGSCGTKSTNSIKITVNPLPTPTITGNTGPCLNYTEEYSTPNIAGHTYTWSVSNGNIISVINTNKVKVKWDIAFGPATVSVTERISATTCTNTVTLNLTVNPLAPGAAGAITGLSNMCYAQNGVTYSIAPVANASNYVWSVPAGVNIVSGLGTPSIVVNFTPSAVSPVTISVYPENGCGSGGTSSKIITIYPQLNGGTIGSAQTICNGSNVDAFTSSAPATGGAGSFTYTWQYTTNMVIPVGDPAWNNIASSNSETYDYGTLTTTTRFIRKAVEGTCSTPVYSNEITVTVRPALNGGNIGINQTICYGADVAAFSSSNPGSGGAGSFTYLWQYTTNMSIAAGDPGWTDIATATGLTYDHNTLTTTTRFVRKAIEGTCTTPVYSNILTVTVRSELNGGTIGNNQTICYSADVAPFTSSAAATGGAGVFIYTWQYTTNMTINAGDPGWNDIGASNTLGYDYGSLTTTTRFVRKAVEGTCTTPVYSNIVTVTVRPALNGGNVGTSQTICNGDNVPAFTSSSPATGGAGSFIYTWQYTNNLLATPGDGNWTDIGSSNSETYDHGILNTTTKFVRKAVEGTCTTVIYSNEITITVMPALNSGAIGSHHTICYGEDVPAFTSLTPASGGGGSFSYTWQYTTNMAATPGDGNWTDIGSSNSAVFDYGKLTAKTMFVRKAEDASCTTPVYSNVITISVNPLPVTSLISGPSVLCEDATNKVYQVVNKANTTFTWTVPASLEISSPLGLFFIIVDAVPGMATPTDTIYVTETYTPTGCVGLPVKLPVNVVPVIPGVVVNGPATICLGDTATYFVPDNSGSTYSWSVPAGAYLISDPTLHSVKITFKMALTGQVSVIETSNGVCTKFHTPVNVTVNPLPTIFNLTAPLAYCAGASGVTITLSGSQAGVNYQLYNSAGPVDLQNGTGSALTWINKTTETYHVVATNATTGCKQLMNGIVVPVVNIVDGGQIDLDQAVCENSTPAAFTSTVAGTAGGVLTYQWQSSPNNSDWTDIPGATSAVYASGPLSANTYFRRMAFSTMGSSVCKDPSSSVLVTVIIFNPGSIGSDISICEGTAPAAAFSSVSPSGTGAFTFRWLSSTDGVNYSPNGIVSETFTPGILNVDTWFKREVTSTYLLRACIEETNAVKVTVINFSPGSIGSDQTICSGSAPAPFTSVAATGDGSFVYSWESSSDGNAPWTTLGANSPTYSSGTLTADLYFRRAVTSTHGGTSCTLYTNIVHVTVNDFDPGIIGLAQTICEGTVPAQLSGVNPPSGDPTAAFTYQWQNSTDGTNFSSISGATNANYTSGPLLVNTYFRRQVTSTLNGKACIELTPAILIKVNNLTSGSIDGTQTVCENEIPAPFTESAAPVFDGTIAYQWQESANGTGGWTNVTSGGNTATYSPPAALTDDMWFKRLVTSTLDGVLCTKESNIIKVTVNNFQPGSIADNQSICENIAAAPITSVSPSGDGAFTYRWKSSADGIVFAQIGAFGETYNPGILAADTWYRRIVRSTLNGKTCIDSTNVIKINVINFSPGAITGDQNICEGDIPAAFGSNLPSGDGPFTYEWKQSSNGIVFTSISSSNVAVYTPPALTADTWYKRAVTSSDGIASCTLETNPIRVTVINFNPGSIASDQTICEGTAPAQFTSVAASGEGSKTYQWQFSTDSTSFSDVPSNGINATYQADPLAQKTWFRRISYATIDTKTCFRITDTVRVKVISFDPGTIGASQTICEGEVPAAFTEINPASGNGIKTYLWQSSLDNITYNGITGATNSTYVPGPLTQDTHFRRQVTSTLDGRTCVEWTPSVFVRVNNMTPGSISGTQTICADLIPAAFTSVPATGDGTITYQWIQSADNGVNWGPVPSGGDVEIYIAPKLNADMWYKRVATSTADGVPCVEESNVIMVTVNNFNPGNIAADQTICENTAPAPFTSTTPTGDGVFGYRWFRSTDGLNFGTPIPTAVSETYSPGILAQDTWYFREVTSTIGANKCIARTDTLKITVNNFDPGNIIGSQTICEDSAPTEFTVTTPAVSYDGSIITYQWQDSPDGIFFTDINLATGPTYTSPALSADTWFRRAVKSALGSNECTEYTDIIKVTVINFAPGSIGSDQTICEGTAPASFTSVAASGDGTKSYQWQNSTDGVAFADINLATNTTYTSPALTQDTWFRRLSKATANSVTCTEITDTIRITVINFDPGTISAAQTICEGETPAAFTSAAPSGDGTFAFQWQSSTDGTSFSSISGATVDTYAPGALTVDTWFKRQVTATVNGMSCIEFTPAVKITVNNLKPGSIAGAQTICVNGTPAALTSVTAATGDGTITYQWKESADNGSTWADVPSAGNGPTYSPPALAADMLYKRFAFSDLPGKICPAESNTIKITVINFNPGSIGDDQTICEGTAPNALTSVSPSGDGSFTYKWYRSTDNSIWTPISGAVSETYSPGILTMDTWYYREVIASIGVTSCPDKTNTVLITVNNFNPGSLDPDQTICEGGDPAIINGVLPSGDGLNYTYKWYESSDGTVFTEIATATSATYDPPALSVDTWYKRAATSHLNGNACTEETAPVRIWVINFAPGTIGADQTICESTAPAPFTGTAPSGDGAFTYAWEYSTDAGAIWSSVPGGITTATYSAPALTVDTWYRRVVTSSLNGFTCSETTPVVIVTVNNFDPGTISANQWICEGDTPAPFGSGSPLGDGIFTYQWQSSLNGTTFSNITGATNETFSAGPLAADTWYRRQVTSTLNGNSCTEATAAITVTVNNLTAGAIGSDQIICEGTAPVTLTSVTPTFDGVIAYEWQSSTDGINFAPVGGANSETYTPPALTADTWYKRIVTSILNGVPCSKESNIVKITVNNFDPGSISADQTICEGSAPAPILSVTPTGDGVFSYKWFRSTDGTNYGEIFGALSETYNPGNLIADTWYRREVTSKLGSNTCTLVNNAVKITVNNLDPGLVTGEQVICEGVVPAPITGTAATGDGSIISYQWRISNDGVNYTDITTDGQNKDYIPGALTQDTWFLRMATSDLGGQKCTEISGSFRVIVNNVNPGTIISDQTICNGSDPVAFISVVHGTGDGTITYEWQISTNGTVFNPIASSNAPNYDSPALTQDTWFRRITRSEINLNICEKISNVVKVTVNEVHGGTIGTDQPICFGKVPAPLTSKDDGSGTGAVTYQWLRSGDGVIWNTLSGANLTTYAPGVLYADTWYKRILISIQNGVLCQAESNPVKITVNSLPVAVLTGGETICPGDVATLTINITDGTAPYVVDIENHGQVTITTSTANIPVKPLTGIVTYKLLKVTDFYGCEAVNMIGTATVTVRDLPVIVKGPTDKITCEYGVVKFDVVATGTDKVYQWSVDKKDGLGFIPLGDAGIYYGAQTPTLNLYGVTRDMNGYLFHVTVTNCGTTKQSADVKLTVNTVPEIQQNPKDTTICSTKDAAFAILATGTNLTYRWQFKPPSGGFSDVVDGGIFTGAADSILYLTKVPGTFNNYLFRVIVGGKCGSALYSNIVALRVNVPPVPVLHPKDKAVCDGSGPVFFVGNGAGMIDSLRWQVSKDAGVNWEDVHDNSVYSGATTQQLSLINVPIAYNNYCYKLALKAFCETTYTDSAVLTVNKLPVVTFAKDPIPACGGVPLVITPVISGGSGTWLSHNWSGDIGPLNNYFSATPTFKTLIAETYTLNYRVVDDNMCAGEGTVKVVVDAPDATFSQDISMECTPATVKFSKDMAGLKSWEWDFGDGTPVNITDATVEHVFTNTTSTAIVYRTIKLTVESMAGCIDSVKSMMTIYPSINANLTADDDTVCHGNQLTFTADPGANIYKWDYGDGTPVVPGINTSKHMFLNPTGAPFTRTVEVVTTSLYGCKDSTTIDIIVMPMPQVQFIATPPSQTFQAAGNNVIFTDQTTPVSTYWKYSWDFGDGGSSTVQNPSHTYNGTGTYNVMLTVSNGKCSGKVSHPVIVLPIPPVADFDSIPSGCAPLEIVTKNTSLNTEIPGTTYRWDFGDGSYSTAKEPAYTYFTPGEYRVELTVTGPGGVSMESQVVRAFPSPKAYFEASPALVFVNDERVRCFNLTQGADYYVWEFGDGDTSRMRDPYHKYMEEGVYDITLWAYSNNGCSDVFILSPGVTVQPPGDVRFSTVFTPNKTGPIERSDLPTGGNEMDQFFFPPIREKVIRYKLQIFNRWGVLIFESNDINIPWNGYYKGNLCPQGVYVWYVEGKYANGKPFKKVGDITLLH